MVLQLSVVLKGDEEICVSWPLGLAGPFARPASRLSLIQGQSLNVPQEGLPCLPEPW